MSSISFSAAFPTASIPPAGPQPAGPPPIASSYAPSEKPAAPVAPLPGQPASAEHLKKRVAEANQAIKTGDEHLHFHMHEGSSEVVISLIDESTHQVLREFPSEKFLTMMDQLQKVAGMQVDVKR